MMTKWVVTSDSHRQVHNLHTAALLVPDAHAILHAGDETADAQWLQTQVDIPVMGVAGNWDEPTPNFPFSKVCDGPLNVFLTHGHRHRVKQDVSMLAEAAKEAGASIAVFGHTHLLTVAERDGLLIVNPGSVSEPRGGHPATFAVLEFVERASDMEVNVSHFALTGELVAKQVVVLPKK